MTKFTCTVASGGRINIPSRLKGDYPAGLTVEVSIHIAEEKKVVEKKAPKEKKVVEKKAPKEQQGTFEAQFRSPSGSWVKLGSYFPSKERAVRECTDAHNHKKLCGEFRILFSVDGFTGSIVSVAVGLTKKKLIWR